MFLNSFLICTLPFRWANGPDCVKLASPVLLKNTSNIRQINISSYPSRSSPSNKGWQSPSKSTMMTKYGGRNSKSRGEAEQGRTKRPDLLKARRAWTQIPNLPNHLRVVMDLSWGLLWPSCLWIQFQLWPLERTPRSGKWKPQTCLCWSMCLLRDCTSLWLMWYSCRASISTW